MPHDFRTVAFSIPRSPDDSPEHNLWTLQKDGRTAEARTRMGQAGPELRIYHDGTFLCHEVVPDGRNVRDVAEEVKAAWVARGWVVE
jgi:hypothetical protein